MFAQQRNRCVTLNDIPEYIDQALQEWDFVAFFAYSNFESVGRGVVALAETAEGIQAIYGTSEYFQERGYLSVVQQIDAYNPETEFLVHFDATGGTRTLRIGTPEGGRNPKRVWFFEMLHRASETPEDLPEKLPGWFAETCEAIEKAK